MDAAVVEGRKAILEIFGGEASAAFAAADWATPVLFMRSKDGNILEPEISLEEGASASKQTVVTRIDTSGAGTEAEIRSLRTAYLNRLFETAGRLSLAGVDRTAASDAEAHLHLDAIYTALLTGTPEGQAFSQDVKTVLSVPPLTEFTQRMGRLSRQELSALAQLDRHPRLVLLGDPGSGKSTFVNFVALCLAGEELGRSEANLDCLTAPLPDNDGDDQDERQPWSRGKLLPVRVILRDFAARGLPLPNQPATAESLWQFIEADLKSCALGDYAPHLRRELLEQGGLLLLDGLDEVPEADRRREQIKHAVEDFARTFSRCRVLVTSRTYAYQQQAWRLPGFAEAVLAPFSTGQIRRFVDRWYAHIAQVRHLHTDDAQGRAELLKRAIFSSDRLRALAERPLLLTLMASLHAWRGGSLPEKREELYADTVSLLLDWWERQRVVRDAQGTVVMMQPSLAEWLRVDREKVRGLLNELAYQAHAGQPDLVGTADIPEEKLVSGLVRLSENPDVKPARLVEYLRDRAGLLVPRGVGVYAFPHRTFQEYLAACYLTDHDYPDELARLVRNDPNRWREVALLAAAKAARGAASTIWLLVEALCLREAKVAGNIEQEVWGALLAGQTLAEVADLARISPQHEEKVARIRRWQVHILRGGTLPAVERAAAGNTLAKLGDPRSEVMTIEGMQFCSVPAGPFLMGSPDKDEKAFDDERPSHRLELPYDYWMARYPVTNAQFRAFVEAGGYYERRYWTEAGWTWREKEQVEAPPDLGEPWNLSSAPMVAISWYEALAFTRWLTEWLREQAKLPDTWEVSLPSEAEWEKAARGGETISVEPVIISLGDRWEDVAATELRSNPHPQRRYPWSDTPEPDRANYDETNIGTTSAVGCFPDGASPYGVEEMSGNVWEWTRSLWGTDWQKPDFVYPYKPQDGREDLAAPQIVLRVLRGGAFHLYERLVRCAIRYGNNPVIRYGYLGFRVVVVPPCL